MTYGNIVNFLINRFPEFTKYDKENLDIPHVILGNFADFVVLEIDKNPGDKTTLEIFDLINNLFEESDDIKLIDAFQIEVFENFAQSENVINFSRRNLIGKARDCFEKSVNDFGIESMRLKS